MASTFKRRSLLGALALAGCQQPGTLPITAEPRLGPDRTGYIGIAAPLTGEVRAAFIGQVTRLIGLGAAEIRLLLNSPGGPVAPAQSMIAAMDGFHAERGVRFTTHNVGVVAGGACYVFLAGQRRLSVPRGRFLFQGLTYLPNGAVTSQALQEANAQMRRIEQSYLAMLTSRTRLTPAEASSFLRRTTILDADEAKRDGVIEGTAEFTLPPGATLFSMTATPRAAPPSPSGTPSGG